MSNRKIRFATWHPWFGSTAYHYRPILLWFDTTDKWTRSQCATVTDRATTGIAITWRDKARVKSEKLEAAKTEAKAVFVAKVGSLFGSNKLKEEGENLQQCIFALENQNKELIQQIKTMERKHKEERNKFNEYVDKIQRYFHYVEKLLPLIDFCRTILKFSERVIQELCKLKEIS